MTALPPTAAQAGRTFLLGAGCQKGGTTWLHHHLEGSQQYARGYRKEYHVLDSLDLPFQHRMRNRILRQAKGAVAAAQRGEPADAEVLHRASMYADPTFYYDYFAALLDRQPDKRLAADMTPESGLLPRERLSEVVAELDRRDVRAVSIYLMRDPVDRIWSQLRMQDQRQPERFDEAPVDVLRRVHTDEVFATRSHYDVTVANLDATFGPDRVLYAFYEELFTDEQVERISSFLGIDVHPADFATRRNSSPGRETVLPDDLVREIAEHHRDVYEHLATRFDRDLAEIWPSARHVL